MPEDGVGDEIPVQDIYALHRREIVSILSNIKISIDRYLRLTTRSGPDEGDLYLAASLQIEELRLLLQPRFARIRDKKGRISYDMSRFLSRTQNLLQDPAFVDFARSTPYHFIKEGHPKTLLQDIEHLDTVYSVLSSTMDVLLKSKIHNQLDLSFDEDASDLKSLVPAQKISPVQFDVVKGKLVVLDQVAKPDTADIENVANSRDVLIEKGNALAEVLRNSNCDKRLLATIDEINKEIASGNNIIKLGLINIGCEAMCTAFEAELPDAIKGMMQGHVRGVSMYIAQFPEWQMFSEKAASVNLTAEDIEKISVTAEMVARQLQQDPRIADPRVPKTILALRELINHPGLSAKRGAFAVLRTLENLIARSFQFAGELFEKTAKKTVDGLSTTASRVIVASLLAVALSGAAGLTPIGAKVMETNWMNAASKIVQEQLREFMK